jgi:hypothetical protein
VSASTVDQEIEVATVDDKAVLSDAAIDALAELLLSLPFP